MNENPKLDCPVAKNLEESWGVADQMAGKAHGWIQWKGTDVCMDVHCACGELTHIDADFLYSVKCSACGRMYACNGHIQLIQILEDPDGRAKETNDD